MGREMTYVVEALTNYHGGESNVRRIGEYEALADAIRASKQVIDEFLIGKFKEGMTAADLFFHYKSFGEVPFIFCDEGRTITVTGFNHFEYSMSRCSAICTGNASNPAGSSP